MIFGIGVDLLNIERIQRLHQKYGERFEKHVLTLKEMSQYHSSGRKTHYLATRFSGKEAISKALGTGLRSPVTLHSISIMSNEIGKPDLFFDSKLQHYLDKHHVTGVFVSFSHEGGLLNSYALAERDQVV